MDLFINDSSQYFQNIINRLKAEIEGFSDEKIMNADFAEWVEYYYSKFAVLPITLYADHRTRDMREIKMERQSDWRTGYDYGRTFMVDAFQIDHIIPFDGTPDLFNLHGSTRILTRFFGKIINPFKESLGSLTITFEYESRELQRTDVEDYIQKEFESEFKNYEKMVTYINTDASKHNENLRNNIHTYLDQRKRKASTFLSLRTALNIPLHINPNAPNVIPIPLKREVRLLPQEPKTKPLPPEYNISDKDYDNIKRVIDLSASAMEKTASTHNVLEEEQLRDILLATIESHYTATGEAYRKIGKTDIQILFDNKAAYIAECKIWHGIKIFNEAIEQLFGYMTWRDTKVSIIVFNKDNKDFLAILNTIEKWVKENTNAPKKEAANIWQCVIQKPDMMQKFNVNIAVYDLNVRG